MAEPYRGENLGPLAPSSENWDAYPVAGSKAADDWSAFPVAKTTSETAKDVGKSLVAGVGKGIAGLVGLPGLAAEYGARGIDRASRAVGDVIGVDVPKREDREVDYGPESVQKAMESVTGEFHKPQTTAGHYAETVGEFVPAVAAGPGGVVRRLALGAVVPGVASEAAGQATKGTGYEVPARLAAGLTAGGVGAALSRPSSAQQLLRGQLPEGITEQHVANAERMIQEANARGINLSWPEALSQSAGRPVLTETQRMVESSPETRSQMQEFFGGRPQQFDRAALDAFHPVAPGTSNPSQIGPQIRDAANETIGDVRKAINKAAEPHYQAAEGVLLTDTPPRSVRTLGDITSEGPVRASHAIRAATTQEAIELAPTEMSHVRSIPGWTEARDAIRNNPQLNSYVAHLPDNSVGFLNEVKKYFDQQGKNASSKFNQGANQQVSAVHEKAASAVKQIAELKSPEYAAALEIQRQARQQYLDPLLQGPLGRLSKKDVTTQKAINTLFPTSPLPNSHNEVHDAVSVLAQRNPWAARQLVRAYAEQTFNEATRSLQSGANQFGPANFAKAIVGNPQQRENLRAAIEALPNGQQLWQGFDRFLEIAEATRYRQTIGSKTAFNDAERKAMSASNLGREAIKTGASPGKWWTIVSDKIDRWSLGRNLDEIARIFTEPQSAALLTRIVRMPPASNEAGAAVARLIAQSVQSANKPKEPARP